MLARPHRTAAGYRQYPAGAEARVRLVRRALALGFTLAELARILRAKDRGGAPCREVRALAAGKLEQVEAATGRPDQRCATTCAACSTDWDDRLKGTPEGNRAYLLEMLLELPSGKGRLS